MSDSKNSDQLRLMLLAEGLTAGIGGIAMHTNELARSLKSLGHRVIVVSPNQFPGYRNFLQWRLRRVACPPEPSLEAWELPVLWSPRRSFTPTQVRLRFRPWLNKLARKAGIQIVHWHGIDLDCDLTRALPPGVGKVFTNHSSQFLEMTHCRTSANLIYSRFMHADRVITPSRELAERTEAVGFPAARIHYISNGVDTERFRPDAALRASFRAARGIEADALVTVCARRLVPKNGLIHLAGAAARLDNQPGPPVVLLIAGDGTGTDKSYERMVMEQLARLHRRVRVQWLRWVPTQEMPAVFAASDIAILPSLVEATSLAGLEAMASGCALIGTRTGGIPEIIQDGKTGWLIPPGDPDALMLAWNKLLCDPLAVERLGSAARSLTIDEFSWRTVAQRTVNVYQAVLASVAAAGSVKKAELL